MTPESMTTIFITIDKLKDLDWTSIITALIAFAALITTVLIYHFDNKDKKSEFYLKKIEENFNHAIFLLEDGNNNNIKWHQAIDLLKAADMHLKLFLTNTPHKIIYVSTYVNTAYAFLNIIKNIASIDFFYGTDPEKSYKSHTRIAPESLKWLCCFIEKANQASNSIQYAGNSFEEIFNAQYFREKNIGDLTNLSGFMTEKISNKPPQLYFILEYIKDIESTEKVHE